jgi:hypothetical protein
MKPALITVESPRSQEIDGYIVLPGVRVALVGYHVWIAAQSVREAL